MKGLAEELYAKKMVVVGSGAVRECVWVLGLSPVAGRQFLENCYCL